MQLEGECLQMVNCSNIISLKSLHVASDLNNYISNLCKRSQLLSIDDSSIDGSWERLHKFASPDCEYHLSNKSSPQSFNEVDNEDDQDSFIPFQDICNERKS